MPRELFDGVAVPPRSVPPRRSPLVWSVLGHLTILAAAAVLSMLATDRLPVPHESALAFYNAPPVVHMVDIDLPPEPRAPSREPAPSTAAAPLVPVSAPLAPLVAPSGIGPETGLEEPFHSPRAGVTALERGAGFVGGDVGLAFAPPPPPPKQDPVRLHSGIQAPVKVHHEVPEYPTLARQARQSGTVVLEAVIDRSGRVESVHVLRSIRLLDQAALDAVRRWTFLPARLNGVPIPVVMTVTVTFSLESGTR